MNETVLSDLVKEWGDFLLIELTSKLYQSWLVNVFLYFVFILAFIRIGRSLASGEGVLSSFQVFICWFLILPVDKKPVFYHLLNTVSTSASFLIQKSMFEILTIGDTRKVIPPGFVFNSIMRAGLSDISDPSIRADVRYIIDNCIPAAENYQGKPLSALDIFGGVVVKPSDGIDGETFVHSFDSNLLKNRKISVSSVDDPNSPKDCYELLVSTRTRVRQALIKKNLTEMPEKTYYGSNAGELADSDIKTTWNGENDVYNKIKNISINLAEAQFYQKSVLKDYFRFREYSSYFGTVGEEAGRLSPLTVLSTYFSDTEMEGRNPTRYVTELANLPRALAKTMGIEGAVDAGFTLKELNDHMIDLPMKISAFQLFLKMIAPIIILLILVPKAWSVVSAWSLGFFLTLMVPVLTMFSRAIVNQVIYWSARLDKVVNLTSAHAAFLNTGVSFDAANALVVDASKWMAIFLEVEQYISISVIMIIPLLGGVYTHHKVAGLLKNTMNAGTQELTRKSVRGAIGATGSVIKKAGSAAMPYVVGMPAAGTANLARKAFQSLYNKTRGPL